MQFYPEGLSLPESIFAILRDLIHEHTGLFFDDKRRDVMADRLSPLAQGRGFDSFMDYYYLLKYDGNATDEWQRVIDALAVQETFFWREIDQVEALVKVLVPQYVAATPGKPLRIWCAACATGEEPLSIAMALNEAGWFDRLPIVIHASDASPKAISKAERGLYGERSFRTLPAALKEKYFSAEGKQWRISEVLQARVQWATINLRHPAEVKPLASSAVIFCRNVFIYFSEEGIRSTVRSFWEMMPTPGYLCISVSESLLRVTNDFELQEIGGAFIYVKR
ncbi:MAG: protein-glutamate O-methyltransferase CheR [Ardenticatenales bacterium]|nr:protein-glutamate O-methyltransferase CheR [Ardenticatenales bacterium]